MQSFIRKEMLRKIRKEKQEKARSKTWPSSEKRFIRLIYERKAYSLGLAIQKGVSCWVNALPLKKFFKPRETLEIELPLDVDGIA